jgi:predicted ATP-grasp superfamily ATP-dependent carboligase
MPKSWEHGAVIIGGDFQGLGIARNLAPLGIPVIIVDPDFCIGRFSRFVRKYYKCPALTDPEAFVSFLERLAIDKGLTGWIIYPTSDRAVFVLSRFRSQLSKYYLIPTPDWEITKFAYDKKLTCQLAQQANVPAPETFFPQSVEQLRELSLDFPVILKPTIKENFFPFTKLKALKANNEEELIRGYKYMNSIIDASEIMIQELIRGGPNNLYSFCSLFRDGVAKGKLIAKRQRQHPMEFGNATTFAFTCEIPEIEGFSIRLLKEMKYYGLSEVEFMYDDKDGEYKLLEVNPRTWGWHTLGAAAGVNFSLLLFMDMNNMPVTVDSFEKNVKWVRLLTDVPIVISEVCKGRLSLADYVHSLKGKREFAVLSGRDPLPFIVEVLLAPYFYCKRGF